MHPTRAREYRGAKLCTVPHLVNQNSEAIPPMQLPTIPRASRQEEFLVACLHIATRLAQYRWLQHRHPKELLRVLLLTKHAAYPTAEFLNVSLFLFSVVRHRQPQ